MIELAKTEFALEQIKFHLSKNPKDGAIIEGYFVQYLLVCFYSEIEDQISKIIRNRLHFSGDQKLQTFVYNTNENMIKRAKSADIRDVLLKFGCDQDDILNDVTDRELGYYGSAIANRHNVAHGDGVSITIIQVEEAIEAAKKILESLEKCIE